MVSRIPLVTLIHGVISPLVNNLDRRRASTPHTDQVGRVGRGSTVYRARCLLEDMVIHPKSEWELVEPILLTEIDTLGDKP